MATQAEYDAAYVAAWAIAEKDIQDVEAQLPVFVKPQVESGVEQHMTQIKATMPIRLTPNLSKGY